MREFGKHVSGRHGSEDRAGREAAPALQRNTHLWKESAPPAPTTQAASCSGAGSEGRLDDYIGSRSRSVSRWSTVSRILAFLVWSMLLKPLCFKSFDASSMKFPWITCTKPDSERAAVENRLAEEEKQGRRSERLSERPPMAAASAPQRESHGSGPAGRRRGSRCPAA